MIATILKSKQATEATFAIIETFSKIRQLSRSIQKLSIVQDKADQKAFMQRSGELIAGIRSLFIHTILDRSPKSVILSIKRRITFGGFYGGKEVLS